MQVILQYDTYVYENSTKLYLKAVDSFYWVFLESIGTEMNNNQNSSCAGASLMGWGGYGGIFIMVP